MKELFLKFQGVSRINPIILIDGKRIKAKKNKFGNYEYKFTTDQDSVNIKIVKYLELKCKFWFLINILFFFISLFGILDAPYDSKCLTMDCQFDFKLKDTNEIIFKFNNPSSSEALTIETDVDYNILSNIYYIDQVAKKRFKIMVATRVVIGIACILRISLLLIKILG